MPFASHQANPAVQAEPSLAIAGSKQEPNFKVQIPRNENSVFQLFTKLQIFQLKIKKIAQMVEQEEHGLTRSSVSIKR